MKPNITTRIMLPDALKEYVVGKYGEKSCGKVRFPHSCDLYHILYDLLDRRPWDNPVDRGNVELVLPNRAYGKRPQTYNYLSRRSQQTLARHIETKMWAELHDYVDEQKHLHGVNYADAVHQFMSRYGIESLSEDALLKNYYRWRMKVRSRAAKRGYKKKK